MKAIQKALLCRAVAEQEDVKVSEEEINEDLETRAKNLEISVDFLKDNLEKADRMDEVKRKPFCLRKSLPSFRSMLKLRKRETSPEEQSPSGE